MVGHPAGKPDLLVASAGGHLTQLHLLAARIRPERPRVWVSYDHPHARGLLADEVLVLGSGPSTRSARALARNWRLAGRLLDTGHYGRVISTGAAIAVPFLVRAQRRGIEAHYVESATRTRGPSLSGRILAALPGGVRLHTQYAEWSDDRWEQVTSVFDGFVARRDERASEERPLRVVVSLGTHRYPFVRLVEAVLDAIAPGDTAVFQHGATPFPGEPRPGVEAHVAVSGSAFDELLRAADVVVAHAGTGIVLSALQAGKLPLVVPRRADLGEHVDDHQALTAERLGAAGLARAVRADELTRDLLHEAAGWTVVRDDAAPTLDLS